MTADIEVTERPQAQDLAAKLAALQIVTQADADLAGEFLKEAKATIKAVDAKLKPLIDSANKTHKALTAMRKEIVGPLEEADKAVRYKLAMFLQEQARLQLAAQAQAQAVEVEAAELASELTGETCLPVVVEVQQATVAGISTRQDWDYEVTDFAKVPDNFKCLDEVAVRKRVRALGEQHGIPGIKAVAKVVVVNRS